jgi:hypothetical protein
MSEENWYKFNPLSSITAYELAQILMTTELTLSQGVMDQMPKECKKHFHKVPDPTLSDDKWEIEGYN